MNSDRFYSYPNRTICDVLEEMRKCDKTRNYAAVAGLVEEIQSMGNRMEAALEDKKNVETWTEKRAKLKCEINDLMQKRDKLRNELGKKKK